ncbi:hypothetical protein CAEBREN_03954 [Caenorhabditis brenneri]|uniref:Uncharacterized protein n=1 Tax=Caenorhabditis brenneri TaxID=135651 RepID=G0NNM7_CAEBE|nr:hypothetical protein CAEBREN_03954 [Caenorhabditis brenneri]
MNTAQAYGQPLRPVQGAGNEKAEPLLSIQQTSIDHSMDVMIDSSKLVMANGNSPVGSIEDIFTRLTRRMVFEFFEGHARMEELPCLGDLTNGIDELNRTTLIPMEPYSEFSHVKPLDVNENLHQLSAISMDLDFNSRMVEYLCESVLLDSFDASSTTFVSSLEHFRSELVSQSAEHTIEGEIIEK